MVTQPQKCLKHWSILGILCSLLTCAQAANWPPYGMPNAAPPYQQPQDYNFRPQSPETSGTPESATYSGRYTYAQPSLLSQIPPKFEAEISSDSPYVQENIILTLRVISVGNIEQMEPVLPQLQSVAFQLLHNPISSTRLEDGQSQIVNEMRYMVTSVTPGPIDIQPEITVATSNGQQSIRTTLKIPQALHLTVRPQVLGVQPWLPLEQLALDSNLDAPPTVEAGEPVTLVLKLLAAGALGNQLPSLEKMLQAPDFRVYRGKTEWEGGPSQNGRHVMGTRTEHYTLVPQYGGILRLPELRIVWFNVNTDTVERTSLPLKVLAASGAETGRADRFLTGEPHQGGFFAKMASGLWLPALGVLLLLTGYWLGVWYQSMWGGIPLPPGVLFHIPRAPLTLAVNWLWGAMKRLNLPAYWDRLLVLAANYLPISVKFWLWVRSANAEPAPTLWRRTLQFLSWRALATSPRATWPTDMAERIIKLQPAVKPAQVRQLLKMLDGATYGNQPLDFERWKQDFERQMRPGFRSVFTGWSASKKRGYRQLPPLNPDMV